MQQPVGSGGALRPFVTPCRTLDARAPWRWLALGWNDLCATPLLSAGFGLAIVLVSALVSLLAWSLGGFALLTMLLSGFVYVAPLVGVGLYAVSRARLAGREPRLADSVWMMRRVLGHAGIFALVQLVIILVWARAGMLVTAFIEVRAGDTRALVEFLAVGSVIGSLFASVTFATSAFSLPMIADRRVDMVTACVSSVHAVLRNKWVLLQWALLISVLTAIGFATALLGLGLVMPWLGYASFHAYRDTIDASAWPEA